MSDWCRQRLYAFYGEEQYRVAKDAKQYWWNYARGAVDDGLWTLDLEV